MPTIDERMTAAEADIALMKKSGGIAAWLKDNPTLTHAVVGLLGALTAYLSMRGPALPAVPVDPPAVKKSATPVEVKPTSAEPDLLPRGAKLLFAKMQNHLENMPSIDKSDLVTLFPPTVGNWIGSFASPSPVVDEPEVVAPSPRIEAKKTPEPFRFK